MQGVAEVVGNLGTVGSIAARSTVQGAVQALMGGKFADGALAGLASGLAEAANTNMLNAINTRRTSPAVGSAIAAPRHTASTGQLDGAAGAGQHR